MTKITFVPVVSHLVSGKYLASSVVRFIDGPSITERPLHWDNEFDSKEEAEKYAEQQTRMYIQSNFPQSIGNNIE